MPNRLRPGGDLAQGQWLSLNPGMFQDGMLTTHSERTYRAPEADLLREYGAG